MDLEYILAYIPGYIYWKNLDSVYLGCNQATATLTGLQTRDEIIGKTDYELVDSAIAAKYISDDQYVIKTGKQLITEDRTGIKNSKGLEVILRTEKKPFLNKAGDVIGILGIAVDITDEVDLRSSEIDQSLILNSTPGYVYWKNLDSVYLGCNQDFLKVALLDDTNSVVGKTDHDLSWGADPEIVAKYVQDDKYVISTGKSFVTEDNLVVKNSRGLTVIARTEKKPLYNKRGNIIGVLCISVDITDQKEAERLQLESERQKVALQEEENFAMLARKVAHDINSPLAALKIIVDKCDLPENQRSLLRRATESILDIANNLISNYQKKEKSIPSGVEIREPLLVSDLLTQLVSEKRAQYQGRSIEFKTLIADEAQFAFIRVQKIEFRRAMSNLINNAVDALEGRGNGIVSIRLSLGGNSVIVEIQDNGKGMSRDKVERMLEREGFTDGKENGHGLGLQQVWGTLEHNQGSMGVQSTIKQGTLIQLTFPQITAPNWIAQKIQLAPNCIILILDDDESIHVAWDLRFARFLTAYSSLRLLHFTHGEEAIVFLDSLTPQERESVIFLSDYELLNQYRNGLQIIDASQIKGATLVTSYYSNPKIRDAAVRANVKILPKHMASVVPIDM